MLKIILLMILIYILRGLKLQGVLSVLRDIIQIICTCTLAWYSFKFFIYVLEIAIPLAVAFLIAVLVVVIIWRYKERM